MALGQAWNGVRVGEADCWVFAADNRHTLDLHCLNRMLRNALRAAGLVHRGMHELRHTCLTREADAGIPLNTLHALVRHEKASTTANTYLHSDLVTTLQAVDMLDTMR
jgi:integrase